MKSWVLSFFFAMSFLVRAATAQQGTEEAVWVQIEAHPSLTTAQNRARDYAQRLENVNGFSLGGSWYGIALGPFGRTEAETILRTYRAEGRIPADAYISTSANLGRRFWPAGADTRPAATVPATAQTETAEVVQPDPEPADETPAEARRSERQLSADERKALQIALQAQGFYTAAIDGAFGPGTRRSMADWQAANGYETTGILTTKQRRVLLDQYNAPLISVGMAMVADPDAGIEMQMPMAEVRFSHYEPPFAHYVSDGDLGVRVLLISQPGNQATLFGLYDILQTLEVVPLNGPRERGKDSFTIEGVGGEFVSYTEAALKNGEVKGFMLVWPTGDEQRRQRILTEMKKSFTRLDGVLDPAAGADAEQNIDLVSGLKVRKPRLSRSGFFTDGTGTVVTTTQAVEGCTRITLDHDYTAEVTATDEALGLAVLTPTQRLAPMQVADLATASPRLNSELAVSGFSYEGVLGAPTLTFGSLADVKGLGGEAELSRLALAPLAGDAGGPVIDTRGTVLGMLLPRTDGNRSLPQDVSFAADASAIRALLDSAGRPPATRAAGVTDAPLSPDALARRAQGMTVLVSCWD